MAYGAPTNLDLSACNVTATGGSTVQTLADLGKAVADNATAVATAQTAAATAQTDASAASATAATAQTNASAAAASAATAQRSRAFIRKSPFVVTDPLSNILVLYHHGKAPCALIAP